MKSLLIFRLLLLPAAICIAVLTCVFLDKLAQVGVFRLNTANQEGQALGMLILFYGIPLLVVSGWLLSSKYRDRSAVLVRCNVVMFGIIGWVVVTLFSQSSRQ